MALDRTKPVLDNSRFADGESGDVVTDILGVDDGVDFAAGTVVRQLDNQLTPADERGQIAYARHARASGREGARAELEAATSVAGLKAALLKLL